MWAGDYGERWNRNKTEISNTTRNDLLLLWKSFVSQRMKGVAKVSVLTEENGEYQENVNPYLVAF